MEISHQKGLASARHRAGLGLVIITALALFTTVAAITAASPAAEGQGNCGTMQIDIPGPPYSVTATVNMGPGESLIYDISHEKSLSNNDSRGNWAGQSSLWAMDSAGFPTARVDAFAWPLDFNWTTSEQLETDHWTATNNTMETTMLFEVGLESNGVAISASENATTTIENPRIIDVDGNESPACLTLVDVGSPAVAACPHVPLTGFAKPAPAVNRAAMVTIPVGDDLVFDLIHQRDDAELSDIATGDWIVDTELLDASGQTVLDAAVAAKPPNFRFHRSTYVSANLRVTNSGASDDALIRIVPTFAHSDIDPGDNTRSWLANARTVDAAGAETPVCVEWQECNGEIPTIVAQDADLFTRGTEGRDVILGTPLADAIVGDDGDDVICGLGGNDTIFGQNGDDWISGGDGDDKLRGGRDADTMFGDDGVDDMKGGRDDDMVSGGSGDDDIRGGTGDDVMSGGDGSEVRTAGNGGRDTIDGGKGDDVITGGPRPDVLHGGPGNDAMKGNGGADQINGDEGDDDLRGGWQPDTIDGGDGTDTCNGGTTPLAVENDTAINCETESLIP